MAITNHGSDAVSAAGAQAAPTLPADALAKLEALLGGERVVVSRDALGVFKDPYWIPGDEAFAAAGVVFPQTVEEVQEIVRVCADHGIPVWPHGQGKNFGYGGASPRVRGSLQMSFTRMTAVLEINEDLGYAVVEPGTSWFDLYSELEKRGSGWAVSVPDLGWGSVIGNSMDSGITFMPTGEDFQALCGLEVVLADGSLLRTNHGAHPRSRFAHVFRRNLGPALDPLFVQGNLGIVVRAGVWLNRKQEAFAPIVLSVMDDGDLEAAIDTIRHLRERYLLRGVPTLYSTLRATVGVNDERMVTPDRILTQDEIHEIGERTGVGAWALRAAVWGDRDIIELTLRKIQAEWERIPSGRFKSRGIFAPDEYGSITFSSDRLQAGVPDQTVIEHTPENVGHVSFSPVVALTGTEVRKLVEELRKRAHAQGVNFMGGILMTGSRSGIMVMGTRYDTTDAEATRSAFEFTKRLVTDLGELGYAEYRAHLSFMDDAQEQYSFGDHAYRRFVSSVKDAVDPQGIIMPGRHGIWPANGKPAETADSDKERS